MSRAELGRVAHSHKHTVLQETRASSDEIRRLVELAWLDKDDDDADDDDDDDSTEWRVIHSCAPCKSSTSDCARKSSGQRLAG